MEKIGFIAYSIDNFHSNRFLQIFRGTDLKEKMEISYAWEKVPGPGAGIDEWCAKNSVKKAGNRHELVEKCDALIVFAPENPDEIPMLAEEALKSGKPVFVDKLLADDTASAVNMFRLADKHRTPVYSSSALRYSEDVEKFVKEALKDERVTFISSRGQEEWHRYAIHQLEMAVPLIGTGASRILKTGNEKSIVMAVEYPDDRAAVFNCIKTTDPENSQPFELTIQYGQSVKTVRNTSGNVFNRQVGAVASFFLTGNPPVPREQNLEVVKLRQAGNIAMGNPGEWIPITFA